MSDSERVHGIFQARVLVWVAFPFSRGSSQPRDQIQVSSIAGEFFTSWATREALGAGDACSVPWVVKIPWRRAWQITPVFLPGESPWKEEPGGLQSMGSKESDTTERLRMHTHTHTHTHYTNLYESLFKIFWITFEFSHKAFQILNIKNNVFTYSPLSVPSLFQNIFILFHLRATIAIKMKKGKKTTNMK